MITTISKQGGRRYPQMNHAMANVTSFHGHGTTTSTTTYIVDPSIMYQLITDIDLLFDTTKMHQFFVGFKQSN